MNNLSLIVETIEILEKENPSLHSNMNYELFSQAIAERRDLPLTSEHIPSKEDYNSALGVLIYKESKGVENTRFVSILAFLVIVVTLFASFSAFMLAVKYDNQNLIGMGVFFLIYAAIFIAVRKSKK